MLSSIASRVVFWISTQPGTDQCERRTKHTRSDNIGDVGPMTLCRRRCMLCCMHQWIKRSVPCFRGRQVGDCAQSSFARSGRDMASCSLCSRLCLFVRDTICLLAIAEMPRGVWQNWRCHQQRHVPVSTGAAVSLEVCLTLVDLTVHWVNAAAVLDYKLQVPNVSCSCTVRYLVPSCSP
jgi:hypothetical protein